VILAAESSDRSPRTTCEFPLGEWAAAYPSEEEIGFGAARLFEPK